ncbi:MAG: alkaline phosphatase [Alistipes senegalensis]|nr:alkaline phosphatase [Bacteroides cellulosilyticus]MCM1352476.1 alkaline phosphatase [Alistipes senegalensis]
MKRIAYSLFFALLLWTAPAEARKPRPQTDEKVRNVVLMIGDGMGLAQVASLMIENRYEPTAFDRAQYTAICKTYSANNRVTDSGASATAMGTGHKTGNSRIGVLPDDTPVENMVELAKRRNLATGIVVTSYLTDATPAGFTAHTPSRHNHRTIAEMLAAQRLDIAAGGGRTYFEEQDGRSLIAEMQAQGYTYVQTPEDFCAADQLPILGLFAEKYMPAAPERGDYLPRATEHTLELLGREGKGFFAMIEGSQIDGACHGNKPQTMIAEMRDFDAAVHKAFDYADAHPGTLVVVVADHETGGLTIVSNNKDFTSSESGIEYRYSTTGHSGSPVVLYAYGTGAQHFSGVMENTEIFARIKRLLGL